jgi:hypothetical protein
MPVIAFPHKQRRRTVAAERSNWLACEGVVKHLRLTYQLYGRETFFDTCDQLVAAVIAIRDHEARKAEAGLPLGPGAEVN